MRGWIKKILQTRRERQQEKAAHYLAVLKGRYHTFRSLLDSNNRAVELITELGMRLRGAPLADLKLADRMDELLEVTGDMVDKLIHLDNGKSHGLLSRHHHLQEKINLLAAGLPSVEHLPLCIALDKADNPAAVGGKAAALGKLRKARLCRVPDGFVVPVHACRLFLEQGDLSFRLVGRLQRYLRSGSEVPPEVIEEIHGAIMAAPLPAALAKALASACAPFFADGRGLAVRSSGVSEDGRRHSFAGQFATVLNVTEPVALATAFKEVVASAFNARSIAYRVSSGLEPLAFEMAVLCLEMIPARSAGILFTRDPNQPETERMLATGVLGLGDAAVSGAAVSDIFTISRSGKMVESATTFARKKHRQVCLPQGGVDLEPVPEDEQMSPSLTPEQIAKLVSWSLVIEREGGCPQDVEWAITQGGEPVILQARPLLLGRRSLTGPAQQIDPARILLADGVETSPGQATGRAVVVRNRQDLENMPSGPVILVLHQSMVDAVNVLDKVNGVLVDLGNPADHLSCVAREYGIPMLTGLQRATATFSDGQWLTIESRGGLVVQASTKGIAEAEAGAAARLVAPPVQAVEKGDESPEIMELRELIVQLNLTDAYGPTFAIAECRSLHDIVRYIHEKAVLSMFNANDATLEETSGVVVHLESEVPFMVSIIDLGGGLLPKRKHKRRVTPEEVVAPPFKALWRGIATPGLNWGPAAGGSINGVMSNYLTDHRSARPVGMPNYLIVSRDYLNLNARMDFHFTMVDAVCGFDPYQNYVKFRFKGGGTTPERRQRRANCIARILEAHDFFTDARDDLVNANLHGVPQEVIEEKLVVLGQLLGFTRLLDAVMADDEMINRIADAFLAGNYTLEGVREGAEEKV